MNKQEEYNDTSRIVDILKESKNDAMDKDSISAVMVLEHEIDINKALIRLIKNGEIKAKCKGDKEGTLKTEDFGFYLVKKS